MDDLTKREHTRGSEWLAIRRCLTLLQRLIRGPARGIELIAAVRETVGREAYPAEKNALKRAFKRDRENLRRQLDVAFSYDPLDQVYTLTDPGPYGYLELSGEGRQALELLSRTFAGEMGERAAVHQLVSDLVDRLSPADRRKLEARPGTIEIDVLQGIDPGLLSDRVWNIVQKAVQKHRKLAFSYLSPQQADGKARYHEVAPYRIRYQNGHWYLHAYDLYWRNPYGEEGFESGHQKFRLSYIVDDEQLLISPTVLPAALRRAPRYLVHYRLLPALGRGAISSHFMDMEITHAEDGSAEVRGATDDEWEAVQILLRYGENCVVLGGPEVSRLMEQKVRGMVVNYGFLEV